MQIGILGGSFNPVHHGHLVLAEHVRDRFNLERVLFVPSRQPPHKSGEELLHPLQRAAMVEAAVRLNPRFEISRIELNRQGPSYTVDTLRELHGLFPGAELHFIIGSDSLPELPSWKDIEEIGRSAQLAVGARPGFSPDCLEALRGLLSDGLIDSLKQHFVEIPTIGISSTDIRERLMQGRSIRHLVPPPVFDYIRTHRLYMGS